MNPIGTPPVPPTTNPVGPSPPTAPQLPSLVDSPPQSATTVGEVESFYRQYLSRSFSAVELYLVNVPGAYANLYNTRGATGATRPGQGVTIGFIDSGLDTEHPAFAGKTIDVEYFDGTSELSDVAVLGYSHGTSVVSIATGVRPERDWCQPGFCPAGFSGLTSEGVAPGADIEMFVFDANSPDYLSFVSAAMEAAFVKNVDILNMSFGPEAHLGIISDSRHEVPVVLPVFFQTGRAEKTVFVWSGGNANGENCTVSLTIESCQNGKIVASSPDPLAGLTYRIPELRPFWIAVVATKLDGTIADFSNRCGVAAEWCIAAPGEGIGVAITSTGLNGETRRGITESSGTSFSTPIVTGGLALMKQFFRNQLSNVELVSRMYATATKTGRYADSSIYGQGLLNLKAATEPVGTAGFSSAGTQFLSKEAIRRFSPLSAAQVEVPEAFGDGLSKSLSGREIAAFDSLGAPFWYPLETFALQAERSAVQRQLRGFMDFTAVDISKNTAVSATGAKLSAPLFTAKAGGGDLEEEQLPMIYLSASSREIEDPNRLGKSGHLSFIDNPLFAGFESGNFSVFAFTSAERVKRHGRGAVVSYRLPNLPLSFRSGYISESGSVLGATAEGVFGGLSASTVFASISWDYKLGDWRIVADAEAGAAYPEEVEAGFIDDVSRLATSSFSAGLIRELPDGSAVKFSVSSPLRVESGRMRFVVPVGRTPGGEILRDEVTANLEPSGRQIDIGVQVVAQTSFGRVSFAGVMSHEPGHYEDADASMSFLAGYSMIF